MVYDQILDQASNTREKAMQAVIGLWADRTDLPETDDHIRAVRDGSNRAARLGFPLGIAKGDPLVPEGDAWWAPMTDAEADEWLEPSVTDPGPA